MPADAPEIADNSTEGMELLAAAQSYDAAAMKKILDENPLLVDFADEKGRRPITVVLKRAHARDMGEEKGLELVKLLMDRGAAVDNKVLLRAYMSSTMMVYGFLERAYMDRNPSDKGIRDMIRAVAEATERKGKGGQPISVNTGAPKRSAPL
jgi:20S proteasome alpha/beta subunit